MREILAELDRLYAAGDRDAAEAFLTAQMEAARSRRDHGAMLTLYNEQSGFLRSSGRPKEAVAAADRALELIRALGLEDTPPEATTRINRATAARMAGETVGALADYEQAGRILKENQGEDSYLMASLYNNMSQVYQTQGRPAEAAACLEKALTVILKQPERTAEAAVTRTNLALAQLSLDEAEKARACLEAAAVFFDSPAGEKHPHRGSWLSARAELAWKSGNPDLAAGLYEKALENIRRHYGENDAYRITAANLARVRGGDA